MRKARTKAGDLHEACLREALAIIGESGPEGLSLRDIARRLGVSHQAPYRHFPSRDHLLAELVARAFADFAAALDARPRGTSPEEDLAAMGDAYIAYATAHPLHYRLMFMTRLPEPSAHPRMMEKAQHAFALLRDCLAPRRGAELAVQDAMFVWATVHGLASIRQTRAMETLGLADEVLRAAMAHAMGRIGQALA